MSTCPARCWVDDRSPALTARPASVGEGCGRCLKSKLINKESTDLGDINVRRCDTGLHGCAQGSGGDWPRSDAFAETPVTRRVSLRKDQEAVDSETREQREQGRLPEGKKEQREGNRRGTGEELMQSLARQTRSWPLILKVSRTQWRVFSSAQTWSVRCCGAHGPWSAGASESGELGAITLFWEKDGRDS